LHIIHQFLPDHVGGTEHYARSLALAQRRSGHQVALFCRRSNAGQRLHRESFEGLPVYRAVSGHSTPTRRFRSTLVDPFLADCLADVIAEARPELVHIHHLMGLPASTLLASDLTAPLIVTLHDYWWVCANTQLFTDYGGQVCEGPRLWLNCARCGLARVGAGAAWPLSPLPALLFAWRAAILRRLVPQVAAWIAPTAFVRDWHVAHGFPTGRLHVIGHGLEPLSPDLLSRVASREEERAHHFVYVGGLSRQKGVHVLIEAFNNLPEAARLTIAGDETAFPGYCTDLRRRAKHPGIHFAGRLDRAAVWELLAAADALVVPSLWYETASLVVQEGFAAGIPVVVSGHGALAERVRHGVDGLHFPPGDVAALCRTLQRLSGEPGLLPCLRQNIRPVRTIDEHEGQVAAVYCQTLAQRRA
jgi:glycosyltransferase involved in cell wall biosynthesis